MIEIISHWELFYCGQNDVRKIAKLVKICNSLGISLGFEPSESQLLTIISNHYKSFENQQILDELRQSLDDATNENEVLHIVSYALTVGIDLYEEARSIVRYLNELERISIRDNSIGGNNCDEYLEIPYWFGGLPNQNFGQDCLNTIEFCLNFEVVGCDE